jgi:hypothetical protein
MSLQIKRMMWSIVLLTVAECVEDDAGKMMQVAAKSNEKEGALESAKDPTAEQKEAVKEKCLRKLFDSNVWLKSVLADATSYAQGSNAMDPGITSYVGLDLDDAKIRAAAVSSSAKSQTKSDNEDSIFRTDLWPLLKARGWATVGPGSSPYFVLDGKVRALVTSRLFLETHRIRSNHLVMKCWRKRGKLIQI